MLVRRGGHRPPLDHNRSRKFAPGRVLNWPPLLPSGDFSYSAVNLWHWSVIALSRWTIGIHAWSVPFQHAADPWLANSPTWIETPLGASHGNPKIRSLLIGFGIQCRRCKPLLCLLDQRRARKLSLCRPSGRHVFGATAEAAHRRTIHSPHPRHCLVNRKAQPRPKPESARLFRNLLGSARDHPGEHPLRGRRQPPRALISPGADCHSKALASRCWPSRCPFPGHSPRPSRPCCARFQRKLPRGFLPRPGPATPC